MTNDDIILTSCHQCHDDIVLTSLYCHHLVITIITHYFLFIIANDVTKNSLFLKNRAASVSLLPARVYLFNDNLQSFGFQFQKKNRDKTDMETLR